MVMPMEFEMEVHPPMDASFLSIGTIAQEDENVNVVLIEPDSEYHPHFDNSRHFDDVGTSTSTSMYSQAHQQQHKYSMSSMDNTRQTLNTQTSILDLTKDEDESDFDEDDEDDDASVLFHDLQDVHPTRLLQDADEDEDGDDDDADEGEVAAHCKVQVTHETAAKIYFSKSSSVTPETSLEEEAERVAFDEAKGSSMLGQLVIPPDNFFDNLCYSHQPPTPSRCHANMNCTAPCGITTIDDESTTQIIPSDASRQHPLQQLESDVWDLLGCTNSPSGVELESIWNQRSPMKQRPQSRNNRPLRASLKKRMQKIHRLRQQGISGESRYGMTLSSSLNNHRRSGGSSRSHHHQSKDHFWTQRAVSMDQEDCNMSHSMPHSSRRRAGSNNMQSKPKSRRSSFVTLMETSFTSSGLMQRSPELQQQFVLESDGYDSDPEITLMRKTSFSPAATTTTKQQSTYDMEEDAPIHMETSYAYEVDPVAMDSSDDSSADNDSDNEEHAIYEMVQQTLNSTWTLTWHPNARNTKDFKVQAKPTSINIWMERGTVIAQTGVVVEPTFMWREAYQPNLEQRKLNETSQKPWSTRVLNMCRIARCDPKQHLDKTAYPFVRSSHALILKTCHGQELVLEASSVAEVDLICRRWKLAVARFASLAVVEDIDSIAQEFFHPTLSAQTLTLTSNHKTTGSNHRSSKAHSVASSSDSSSFTGDRIMEEDIYSC